MPSFYGTLSSDAFYFRTTHHLKEMQILSRTFQSTTIDSGYSRRFPRAMATVKSPSSASSSTPAWVNSYWYLKDLPDFCEVCLLLMAVVIYKDTDDVLSHGLKLVIPTQSVFIRYLFRVENPSFRN